jgi:hypothetical protein
MKADVTQPWIGEHLSVGIVAIICVSLTALIIWLILRAESRRSNSMYR